MLVTFHPKDLTAVVSVIILFQVFFEMTFNVSAKLSLELRLICLALEEIDHSIVMSFIFEYSEFLLIIFLESSF